MARVEEKCAECCEEKKRLGVEVGGTEVGGKVPAEHKGGGGGDIRGE